MSDTTQRFHVRAREQATAILQAIETAETIIVSAIERECEALRAGQTLAAKALHTRLCDAARLYLSATDAARANIANIEEVLPGSGQVLDDQRVAFAALLKVELAVLSAERAAAEERPRDADGLHGARDAESSPLEDRRPGLPAARAVTIEPQRDTRQRVARG